MFERYTERAKRVIFFARYEASQFGSMSIESHHMLLGLIREDKDLAKRFFPTSLSITDLREKIRATVEVHEKISTSIDLPLSQECRRILAYANEEAQSLNHRWIGTEHILLGVLREDSCVAARILTEQGMRLDSLREQLARSAPLSQPPVNPHFVGYTLSLSSNAVEEMLDKHGFAASKEHLSRAMAAKAAGDLKGAQTELKLFLDSLVDKIHEENPNGDLLAPIFESFDWRVSVHTLRPGLSDEEDWKFRLWFTLLLAELLVDRFVRSRS
jgi:ATP-dependent Clp protease ATP-binding subunit ClpA